MSTSPDLFEDSLTNKSHNATQKSDKQKEKSKKKVCIYVSCHCMRLLLLKNVFSTNYCIFEIYEVYKSTNILNNMHEIEKCIT